MIIAQIINPASKLATARGVDSETCSSSIGQVLGIENVGANELYESLDYLLLVCRNPLVAETNKIKRAELMKKTEEELDKIVVATTREKRKLKGKEEIGLRVGKVINKFKVGKYFDLNISAEEFNYQRKKEVIEQEEKLDGIYIIRTSISAEKMDSKSTVKNYKKQLNFVRSESGKEKDRKKRNKDNDKVHSFRTLLEDLGTIMLNKIRVNLNREKLEFEKVTKPTLLQEKILKLLGVYLYCTQ